VDARIAPLARQLLDHSLDLQPGERVLIEGQTGSEELVRGLIAEAHARGALPFFEIVDPRVRRAQLLGASRELLDIEMAWRLARVHDVDARLHILAGTNLSELADVPPEIMREGHQASRSLLEESLKKKWVVLRFPNAAGAQAASMSTDGFEDYCFHVSSLDYAKMERAMDPLVALIEATKAVRITGPGTDLTLRLDGLPVVKCAGRRNVPDGEVFTAPKLDSTEGVIAFNAPAVFDGITCDDVTLTFDRGKVVKATGSPQTKIDALLGTDEGARFVGEFALGMNPLIERPMKDVLYDEKISGSLHMALGLAYDLADNGNRSAIHWDLVLMQTPEWGGGEVWFDGVLVRKDGLFVLPELDGLNPECLVG